MKLISWNVNGIRACLTKGFAETFKKMEDYLNRDFLDMIEERYYK